MNVGYRFSSPHIGRNTEQRRYWRSMDELAEFAVVEKKFGERASLTRDGRVGNRTRNRRLGDGTVRRNRRLSNRTVGRNRRLGNRTIGRNRRLGDGSVSSNRGVGRNRSRDGRVGNRYVRRDGRVGNRAGDGTRCRTAGESDT